MNTLPPGSCRIHPTKSVPTESDQESIDTPPPGVEWYLCAHHGAWRGMPFWQFFLPAGRGAGSDFRLPEPASPYPPPGTNIRQEEGEKMRLCTGMSTPT